MRGWVKAATLIDQPAAEVALTARPPPLAPRLAAVRAASQDLATLYRTSVPPEQMPERIRALAHDGGDVLQERVLELCLLLMEHGPMRYNELRRLLGAISTRTLADKLAFLQSRGLVERRLFDESPPRVEYTLTERGRVLTDLLVPVLLQATGDASLL